MPGRLSNNEMITLKAIEDVVEPDSTKVSTGAVSDVSPLTLMGTSEALHGLRRKGYLTKRGGNFFLTNAGISYIERLRMSPRMRARTPRRRL